MLVIDVSIFNTTICFYLIDVAIGAPQEENLLGAIYIYNGREKGITRSFTQVSFLRYTFYVDFIEGVCLS